MTESFDLFNILAYILVPILTAVLGGCVGAFFESKMDQMIRVIDMGIWDNCLFGNYEMYRNAKAQIEMSTVFQSMALAQQKVTE